MTTPPVQLSTIIVTHNSSKWITNCLESLLKDLKPFSYQIIVVDNASTDQTTDLIKSQFPEIILLKKPRNEGLARACNQALSKCQAEYVLFLNPDAEVISGMIHALKTFMEGHPEAGAIGPALLNADGSLQLSGNTFPSLKNLCFETFFLDRLFPQNPVFGSHKLSHADRSRPLQVDWTMGSCLFVRKKALDQVGGFDEQFFLFFEETDLCFRLRNAGYEIYVIPEAKVIHRGGAGRPENYNAHKIIHYHRSLFHYFRKHVPVKPVWVRSVIAVRSVIRILLWSLLLPAYRRIALEKLKGYREVMILCFRPATHDLNSRRSPL